MVEEIYVGKIREILRNKKLIEKKKKELENLEVQAHLWLI